MVSSNHHGINVASRAPSPYNRSPDIDLSDDTVQAPSALLAVCGAVETRLSSPFSSCGLIIFHQNIIIDLHSV
jgi:hypothetical protein